MNNNEEKFRDLTIHPLSDTKDLVISCDISAGFGDRKLDIVHCSPETSISFTLRTAMLELIAYGAKPISVVDTLSVEYDPTGKNLIAQMKRDLAAMGFENISINGSTEDNLDIQMTTVSVTVIGEAPKRMKKNVSALTVFQLGEPFVGQEVLDNLGNIFSVKQARELRSDPMVVDMLPVGSKGIKYELDTLAMSQDYQLTVDSSIEHSVLKKTAGPSTVLLVAVDSHDADDFLKKYPDLIKIARLRN